MHFKFKIIVSYSLLIIVLALVIGFIFTKYMIDENEEKARVQAQVTCAKMSDQLDKLIQPMEYAAYGLLSDVDLYSYLRTLSSINIADSGDSYYVYESSTQIRYKLRAYAISRQFYRTSILNDQGYSFTNRSGSIGEISEEMMNRYFEHPATTKKRFYIMPVEADPWALSDPEEVFSILVPIEGMASKGFVEVQRRKEDLDSILGSEPGLVTVALNQYGDILYSNGETSQALLRMLDEQPVNTAAFVNNPDNNQELIAISVVSEYSGVKLIQYEDKTLFDSEVLAIRNASILIAAAVIVISILYLLFVYSRITQPMRNLQKQIEATNAADPDKSWVFQRTYDEISSLNKAIIDLIARLNKSFETEKKILLLNEQSNYDLLQAQINPHFIFNVLNILSYRGVLNNDMNICAICDNLAGMIRYSNDVSSRFCEISEEIAYLKNYTSLLKMRYEHKCECDVDLDARILQQRIPKLVLQQFVENCVSHGFYDGCDVMRIRIRGYIEDDWWYIAIEDNGKGFNPEELQVLRKKLSNAQNEIFSNYKNPVLRIGGLGIVNSYCRMLLLYKKELVFEIGNGATGAKARIGSKMRWEGYDETDKGNDR